MADLSADAARTLELLRDADGPLSYEELSDAGVRRPGDAVYELQLVGEPIDQAHGRVRLGHSRPPGFGPSAAPSLGIRSTS